MNSIFEFTNETGTNCLIISFQSMWRCKKKTKKYPTSSTGMFSDIERTIIFLIEEGEKHGLDMNTILNTSDKHGGTLFHKATIYSEKIALALLERNVIVNTITSDFMTPRFKVS